MKEPADLGGIVVIGDEPLDAGRSVFDEPMSVRSAGTGAVSFDAGNRSFNRLVFGQRPAPVVSLQQWLGDDVFVPPGDSSAAAYAFDPRTGSVRSTSLPGFVVPPFSPLTMGFELLSMARLRPGVFALGLRAYEYSPDRGRITIVGGGRVTVLSPNRGFALGEPSSLRAVGGSRLLVTDCDEHVVSMVDMEGKVQWQFGDRGRPSPSMLAAPEDAVAVESTVVIADTMNARVIAVDMTTDSIRWTFGGRRMRPDRWTSSALAGPVSVDVLRDGTVVIADPGDARIVAIRAEGPSRVSEIASWGRPHPVPRRLFSLPRSVHPTPSGTLVVADTNNDRVVEVSRSGIVLREWDGGDFPLRWPRSAYSAAAMLTVADGLTSSVRRYGAAGQLIANLSELVVGGRHVSLRDPHSVRPVEPEGTILVDSMAGIFALLDPGLRPIRVVTVADETPLADPHCAAQLTADTFAITDTGNSRIVLVKRDGAFVSSVTELIADNDEQLSLQRPRAISAASGLVFVGQDDGSVVVCSAQGNLLGVFGPRIRHGDGVITLGAARDIVAAGEEVLVVDCEHHRIVAIPLVGLFEWLQCVPHGAQTLDRGVRGCRPLGAFPSPPPR